MVSSTAEPAVTGRRPARVGPASLSTGPGPSGVRVRRAPLTLRHQAVGGVVPGDRIQPAVPASPSCPRARARLEDAGSPRSKNLGPLGTGFRVGPTPKQLLPSASVVGLGAGARAVAPNPFRVACTVASAGPTSKFGRQSGVPTPFQPQVPKPRRCASAPPRLIDDAAPE